MDVRDAEAFLGLPIRAFDHIPVYARKAALEAIAKVRKLEQEKTFRPGLYYIVLVDLCGSTIASQKLGAEKSRMRVEWFVTACVEALGRVELRNYTQFLKEVGDATLFIFSSFEDLLDWSRNASALFESYSAEYEPPPSFDKSTDELNDVLFESFAIQAKKVVHLGEVAYSGRANPLALAVNQVFKIEKLFGPNQLGCTDIVAGTVRPILVDHGLSLKPNVLVKLPQEDHESMTWIIE
jgi:hypothetical protein